MASLIPDQNIPFFFKLNQKLNNFKQLLITIAAVVLVGCGESQPTEPPTAKAPDISIHEAAKEGNITDIKQHITTGTNVEPKRSAPKVSPAAKVDAKSLFISADLVVVAKAPMGNVLTSSPVQFAWSLKVEKTLKGEVSSDGIRGRHGWRTKGYDKGKMPPWLKTAQTTSCIFFLKQNAQFDEDPLGVIPWTTELEKSLLSKN